MRFNQLKETEKALIKPGTALEKTEEIIKKTFSPERKQVQADVLALARMAEMGRGDKSELLMKLTALTKKEMDVKKADPDLAHSVDSNLKIMSRAVEKLMGSTMSEAWDKIKETKLSPQLQEMYDKFVKVNEAIPTSEFDYDIKKFYDKVQELEDENQHGEVAEMLVSLYGTGPESMVIRGINGMHANQGSIMPEQQKLRDMIATKYYKKLQQEVAKVKEGVSEDTADYEKVIARQTHKHLRVLSEHRRMLENLIIKLAELDKGTGDLTDQLTTMFDLNTKFSAVLRRAKDIVPVYEGTDDGRKKGIHPKGHPMRKKQQAAIAISKKGESIGERSEKQDAFSAKEIKMAIGIASDPRYAKGNMTGAVNAIEKLSKGLSKHKQVAAVLKRQNEDIDLDTSLSEHLKEHGIVKEYGDKQMLMGMNMNYVLINKQNKVQGYASDKKDALDIAKRTMSTMHPIKKKITDKTLEKMNALSMTPKQLADLGIIDEADVDITTGKPAPKTNFMGVNVRSKEDRIRDKKQQIALAKRNAPKSGLKQKDVPQLEKELAELMKEGHNKMGPQGIAVGDRVEHKGDMYEVIAVDGDILTVNNLQNGNRTKFKMDDVTPIFGADAMTDKDEEDLEAMFKRLDDVPSGSLKSVATEELDLEDDDLDELEAEFLKSLDSKMRAKFGKDPKLADKIRKAKMAAMDESKSQAITEAQFDEAAGKKDACYHKVKSRYKVWPSAYASGALVQCRKVGAKNWGNKSKK